MEWFTVIFIGVGLAMDCFAVSLGVGTSDVRQTARSVLRLSFHFGLFQGLMTFAGWLLGNTVERYIAPFDHWIAFVLLAWVGLRMIRSGLNKAIEQTPKDPTRGGTMVMLSVATSLDAMAVGLSMGMLNTGIAGPAVTIGLISFALSVGGILAGKALNHAFGKKMEVLGGVILNLIGLRILITHLL